MFKNIPFERVQWITSSFLIGTLALAVTAVPLYLILVSTGTWFLWALFFFYTAATGLSITLGYHRLFSHLAFKAKRPVKWFVILFGAAAWENSVITWSSEHRRHHKHVDHDDDPYNINLGFWWAHMGWLMFKLKPEAPIDNVKDLEKDPALVWQHKYIHFIAAFMGFVLPTLICGLYYGSWMGALGGFLIVGVLRTVIVQHATFFINSACHYIGSQPYSSTHSARDSWLMAIFTFGEGYHNYHHEFQHDYRNGVKPWQIDPTKWTIWLLSKVGMTSDLRRVSEAKILLAEIQQARSRIQQGLDYCGGDQFTEAARLKLQASIDALHHAQEELAARYDHLQTVVKDRVEFSKGRVAVWRRELREAMTHLDEILEFDLVPRAV
ncbi:acyl-CoA desaturase [Rubellicoccus peritrichatus]|uniref:Fatty acid desaturase n=1 Tax=Rubellicoccus peritrichatus TaxID=3080537 RepID=A0AAQ3LBI2_9BACT|nr:fatty acid desaturase [Puniceicoccus sp. CR14]WOO41287.1 fatty acid desaturase [Puniceicoccus sp. CR14]